MHRRFASFLIGESVAGVRFGRWMLRRLSPSLYGLIAEAEKEALVAPLAWLFWPGPKRKEESENLTFICALTRRE